MAKLNFQQSLLQNSVSCDPSELIIDLVLKKHVLLLKQLCCLIFFIKTTIYFFWILCIESSKEQHLFEIEIFIVINMSLPTLDQIHASLLNSIIIIWILLTPNHWIVVVYARLNYRLGKVTKNKHINAFNIQDAQLIC